MTLTLGGREDGCCGTCPSRRQGRPRLSLGLVAQGQPQRRTGGGGGLDVKAVPELVSPGPRSGPRSALPARADLGGSAWEVPGWGDAGLRPLAGWAQSARTHAGLVSHTLLAVTF